MGTLRFLLTLTTVVGLSCQVEAAHCSGKDAYAFPFWIAGIGATTTIVYDIVTASSSAERHNELQGLPQGAPGSKSGKKAFVLSLAATLIPLGLGTFAAQQNAEDVAAALIVFGATVGPSVGHFYAGRSRRGGITVGLRVALTGLGAWSLVQAICE